MYEIKGKPSLVVNSITGDTIPIALHVVDKCVEVMMAEKRFKSWSESWDHQTADGAKTYINLLNKWDAAAARFAPYANIWYIARHGLSLN